MNKIKPILGQFGLKTDEYQIKPFGATLFRIGM
ncbi:MAG: hypothetical protein JWR09_2170 [Mucilaginibacter sp.]|nr:hypothetical protein [Mucilaginibacter sp.]